MSGRVNLLLLLSALLSALTGVGGSARQAPVAQAIAQQGRAAIVSAVRKFAARPVQPLATLVVSSAPPRATPLPPVSREPAYASRRRE